MELNKKLLALLNYLLRQMRPTVLALQKLADACRQGVSSLQTLQGSNAGQAELLRRDELARNLLRVAALALAFPPNNSTSNDAPTQSFLKSLQYILLTASSVVQDFLLDPVPEAFLAFWNSEESGKL